MKLLIVGASGFIGSHIHRVAKEFDIVTVGTRAGSKSDRLARFDLREDRIGDCVPADYFNDERVCAIVAAGISKIDECRRNRDATRLVNVKGTIQLLDDLAERGATPVFLSTSCVFDGQIGYYNEEDEPAPINEYGRQKLEVESCLLDQMPNSLVLRLDKVVGDEPAESHLLSEWYERMQKGQPIDCLADQILSPTLVDDIVLGVLTACQDEMSGLYHLVNAEFFPRDELARQFAHACGLSAEIVVKPMDEFAFEDPRPVKTYLDGSRFIEETGLLMTTMRAVFQNFLAKARGEFEPADESD
ncbi:MAG: sugar nucleotide-binding protein [Planctomycetaceae bacterium]